MKRTRTPAALLLALTMILLSACGSGLEPIDIESLEPLRFNWGTSGSSTSGYMVSSGIANIINQTSDILTVDVEASAGQNEILRNLADGTASLGQGIADGVYDAYNGLGSYKDAAQPKLRAVMPLPRQIHYIVVSEDSGIQTVEDLKGKKIAVGTAGSSYYTWSQNLLTVAGMTFGDISPAYIQPVQAAESLAAGEIDGMMFSNYMPWDSLTELCSGANVRLIGLEKEHIEKLQEINPSYNAYTIPAGTYPGQDENITTSSQLTMAWTLSESMSEGHMYVFVKTVWETYDQWAETHEVCKSIDLKKDIQEISIPLHSGAYRYYKEIGLKIPKAAMPTATVQPQGNAELLGDVDEPKDEDVLQDIE